MRDSDSGAESSLQLTPPALPGRRFWQQQHRVRMMATGTAHSTVQRLQQKELGSLRRVTATKDDTQAQLPAVAYAMAHDNDPSSSVPPPSSALSLP